MSDTPQRKDQNETTDAHSSPVVGIPQRLEVSPSLITRDSVFTIRWESPSEEEVELEFEPNLRRFSRPLFKCACRLIWGRSSDNDGDPGSSEDDCEPREPRIKNSKFSLRGLPSEARQYDLDSDKWTEVQEQALQLDTKLKQFLWRQLCWHGRWKVQFKGCPSSAVYFQVVPVAIPITLAAVITLTVVVLWLLTSSYFGENLVLQRDGFLQYYATIALALQGVVSAAVIPAACSLALLAVRGSADRGLAAWFLQSARRTLGALAVLGLAIWLPLDVIKKYERTNINSNVDGVVTIYKRDRDSEGNIVPGEPVLSFDAQQNHVIVRRGFFSEANLAHYIIEPPDVEISHSANTPIHESRWARLWTTVGLDGMNLGAIESKFILIGCSDSQIIPSPYIDSTLDGHLTLLTDRESRLEIDESQLDIPVYDCARKTVRVQLEDVTESEPASGNTARAVLLAANWETSLTILGDDKKLAWRTTRIDGLTEASLVTVHLGDVRPKKAHVCTHNCIQVRCPPNTCDVPVGFTHDEPQRHTIYVSPGSQPSKRKYAPFLRYLADPKLAEPQRLTIGVYEVCEFDSMPEAWAEQPLELAIDHARYSCQFDGPSSPESTLSCWTFGDGGVETTAKVRPSPSPGARGVDVLLSSSSLAFTNNGTVYETTVLLYRPALRHSDEIVPARITRGSYGPTSEEGPSCPTQPPRISNIDDEAGMVSLRVFGPLRKQSNGWVVHTLDGKVYRGCLGRLTEFEPHRQHRQLEITCGAK